VEARRYCRVIDRVATDEGGHMGPPLRRAMRGSRRRGV